MQQKTFPHYLFSIISNTALGNFVVGVKRYLFFGAFFKPYKFFKEYSIYSAWVAT